MTQCPSLSYPQWPMQCGLFGHLGLDGAQLLAYRGLATEGLQPVSVPYNRPFYMNFPARQRVNPAFSLGKKEPSGKVKVRLDRAARSLQRASPYLLH